MNKPLVQVKNLNAHYSIKGKKFHVIRDVSFEIQSGETLGLVGESGCGKTTIGKLLLGVTKLSSGEIFFDGKSIDQMGKYELQELRRDCQMVFQDPYGSVNPRMTIEEIVKEPLQIYKMGKKADRRNRVLELLDLVGLDDSYLSRYPHELSGGQRQRIVIARALATNPRFLICDEPVAALDVSIQAQIINLLKELQQKLGLTYLFISHDLAVVKYLAIRTLVMYCGEVVETANNDELYNSPLHPYTSALLESIPIPDPELEKKRSRLVVLGEPPNPLEEIKGCAFESRCIKKLDICRSCRPRKIEAKEKHLVSCHLYNPMDQKPLESKEVEYANYFL